MRPEIVRAYCVNLGSGSVWGDVGAGMLIGVGVLVVVVLVGIAIWHLAKYG